MSSYLFTRDTPRVDTFFYRNEEDRAKRRSESGVQTKRSLFNQGTCARSECRTWILQEGLQYYEMLVRCK